MTSMQAWAPGMSAEDTFTDVSGYLECCKEAASHLDSCLSADKALPQRWPYANSGSKTQYRKEEGGGGAAPVLQQARHIPFPPALIERHRNAPVDYWRMGIFPEICRVWVVLEHRLYLWNYMEEGGTDIVELETPLQERIFGVGLAKPPPGLFGGNVRYMLVLVTPSYVLLHQVVFSTAIPHDEIRLVPTDYFVKSDELCGVGVPHPLHQPKVLVTSTEEGRIFLCGQDAAVHEFLYPKDAGMLGGWVPSAKCRKVTHFEGRMDRKRWLPPMVSRLIVGDQDAIIDLKVDKLRKRLYTLSSRSLVTVYNVEGGPNSTSPVIGQGHIQHNRRPAPAGMVVGIATIPARGDSKNDRSQPDFIAFLEHGEVVSYRVDTRGCKFYEHGSLLPDTNAHGTDAQSDAPMCVNMCHYTGDVVLLAHNGNYLDRAGRAAAGRPTTDGYLHRNDAILHCVHATGHDRNRPRPQGREVREFALSQHPLSNSGVLALAEVPMELIVPRQLREMVAGEWSMPELASQPSLAAMIADDGRDASRWILALSKAGLHCFVKARPIDQFRSALVANQGADPQQMMNRSPLECFSKEEMYAMLLQLACDSAPLSGPPAAGAIANDIREQALHLFMTDAADMSQQQHMLGGQGQWANPANVGGTGWQQHNGWQNSTAPLWGSLGQAADRVMHVSDRHKALACYLTRVLRPIFEKKMKEIYLLEPYKKDVLRSVQQRLHKLRLLLEAMPSLERPQNAEPHRLKGSDTDRPRMVTEEEKIQMTKLYFVVRRSEEACERLQGDAQRFHSKIGADAARRDWSEWENLTFKELIVDEKGQMLFYKVHRHLFLNELQGMDEGEAHRLLQLPRPGTESRSTFWGSWTQRRLQAERYLQLARTRVGQGRPSEGKENLRLALAELVTVVQEDRSYSHEDLRSHCNLLIEIEFNFYESYQGFAQLCLERIKTLSVQRIANQDEMARCAELLCQLVAFLYIDPPRVEMKPTEAPLAWPARGLTHSLDLLPAWFRDRHPNETSEMFQLDQQHLALRCAQICRSQILTTIFEARPPDLYADLHEQIYRWFIENDWSGAQTGATALHPGLFDVVDYSNLHQRRLQPVFLENYLERVTSNAEMTPEAQAGHDFRKSVDALCAFYEAMGKFGKAARKFWNVATTDQPLALQVRIDYMQKAIAIERHSTTRRATDQTPGAAQDGDIKQAEATLWPNCLVVAQLQLDAIRAVSPSSSNGNSSDTSISMISANTPQRLVGSVGGDSAQAIPDKCLIPLNAVVPALHKAMAAARAGAAGVGAPSISTSSVASLLIRCYDAAVVPPEDRLQLAPFICQLWEELVHQSGSLDQALSTVHNLYRDYGLGPDVFTLEDEGGARGLLYRLERKHFEASVGADTSVDECMRKCQVGEERLSRAYYTLITTEAEPRFKLHLLGAATAFLERWLGRVRKAAQEAGTTAAARHGLQEQRRRLVAQCAERLAEYRHLVHAAATGNADEAAARVSQILDQLEAGQRELVELLGY